MRPGAVAGSWARSGPTGAATAITERTTAGHTNRLVLTGRLLGSGARSRNVPHRRYTHSLHAPTFDAMKKRAGADIRERFGFAVKDRREALGLTQEEFAERAGLHRTYLSDIERGTRNVSLINIERVASALSLKISELFQFVERT